MPAGDIYQFWANATPTNPFPFTYQGKGGKIQMTWADVRNGIQKDAVSTALPFCTGHITPSLVQANIIGDANRKEELLQKKWAARNAAMSPSRSDSPTSANAASVRRSLRTAQELDLLQNSEGGRGRKAYLRLRLGMNPQTRFDGRMRTSSHAYGWNLGAGPEDAALQFRAMSADVSTPTDGRRGSDDRLRSTTNGSNGCSPSPIHHDQVALAASHLEEALAKEREIERLREPLGKGIATGLLLRGSSSHQSNDHRRKNTLAQGMQASGVFSKPHA